MKHFVSYVRCASYPDPDKFRKERGKIEKEWPAYAKDTSLCRLPRFFWEASEESGTQWKEAFNDRLQHALSRKNHHIHPLKNPDDDPEEGERKSLKACRPKTTKGKKDDAQACKAGFPLQNELTTQPLIVCECIAIYLNLPCHGPRSRIGDILPGVKPAGFKFVFHHCG